MKERKILIILVLLLICCNKQNPTTSEDNIKKLHAKKYDYEFEKNTFFFVDEFYLQNYNLYHQSNCCLIHTYDAKHEIQFIDVYTSKWSKDVEQDSVLGWAVENPKTIDTTKTTRENIKHFWWKLGVNKYTLQCGLGIIELFDSLDDDEMLAVAYKTNSDEITGVLNYSKEMNNPLILKLVKSKNPKRTDRTWNLMHRNIYSFPFLLNSQFISINSFKIFRYDKSNLVDRMSTKDGLKTNIEIFGFDRCNDDGLEIADGIIDPCLFTLSNRFNHIKFVSLTPFADSSNQLLYEDNYVTSLYNTIHIDEMKENSKYYIEVEYEQQVVR